MALPEFSMRQLLEAGVHYGHQTARWNPRMGEFIYGDRNGIHILDLTQTVPMLDGAVKAVRDVAPATSVATDPTLLPSSGSAPRLRRPCPPGQSRGNSPNPPSIRRRWSPKWRGCCVPAAG